MPLPKKLGGNRVDLNLKQLPKPQKTAVIFLAAVAVFIIVLWVWQINTHINRPFNYKVATSGLDTTEADYNNLLNNTDTDQDGLSDYDEIYVYKTSPYLADTDSDGFSDKQEIDNNADPLCPKGKNCNVGIDTSAASTIYATSSSNSLNISADGATLDLTGVNETDLTKALNGQSDAAALRRLLISSGASAEELNQISDTDLLKSYQETLQSQSQ